MFFCFSTYHITSELIVKEMSSHVRWKQVEKDSPGIYLYEKRGADLRQEVNIHTKYFC